MQKVQQRRVLRRHRRRRVLVVLLLTTPPLPIPSVFVTVAVADFFAVLVVLGGASLGLGLEFLGGDGPLPCDFRAV